MAKEDDAAADKRNEDNRKPNNPWPQQPNRPGYSPDNEKDMKIWGILLFGLIGATATTAAVSFSWLITSTLFNFLVLIVQVVIFITL